MTNHIHHIKKIKSNTKSFRFAPFFFSFFFWSNHFSFLQSVKYSFSHLLIAGYSKFIREERHRVDVTLQFDETQVPILFRQA